MESKITGAKIEPIFKWDSRFFAKVKIPKADHKGSNPK